MNSVYCPGSVSTSILPPCCFTMMSWLIDRPSPVPSPAGLVVKNGLNIFSFTSAGMPVPLSRMRISTVSPLWLHHADVVVLMEDGRVTEDGPTREVLRRPRSRFAAGLAGLNLVSGTVSPAGIRSAEGLEFAGQHDAPLVPGQAGVAAFPPSAVSVFLSEAHGSPRNSFRVTVTDLEPHGDQIRVRAGELSADVTPAASADLGLAPGVAVYFVVKAAAVSIYPA